MISIDEELAALRAENARLRAEQGQGQFPGQAHVRILPSANGAIMPSQDQMRALLAAVADRWPKDFTLVDPGMFAPGAKAIRRRALAGHPTQPP
jgi:hypothetical protein